VPKDVRNCENLARPTMAASARPPRLTVLWRLAASLNSSRSEVPGPDGTISPVPVTQAEAAFDL
jgi:hypothetical protein